MCLQLLVAAYWTTQDDGSMALTRSTRRGTCPFSSEEVLEATNCHSHVALGLDYGRIWPCQ